MGPIAGGLIALGVAYVLRGRGGGRTGAAAAQGRLGDLRTKGDETEA